MNRSQLYKVRTDRHWLSQLLADAACPALVLAAVVSQVPIGHDKKDAPRRLRLQSNELQVDNGFREGADKSDLTRAATESSRFKENTGSEKELAHNQ